MSAVAALDAARRYKFENRYTPMAHATKAGLLLMLVATAGLQVPSPQVPSPARRLIAAASIAALTTVPPTADAVDRSSRAELPIFGSGGRISRLGGGEVDLAAQYAANPADLSSLNLPAGCIGASHVALVFVGSGGPDRETAAMQAALQQQDAASGLQRCVSVINWKPYFSSDTNRLSFISRDIGNKLGAALALEAPGLRSLHIIGTSAGSFAADAVVTAYVEARGSKPRAPVRLSLADPFTAKAGAPPNEGRGAQYFGRSADFAEHVLNTDDPVPNTDTPLPFCFCYDVTGAAARKSFPPPVPTGDFLTDFVLSALGYHNWPLGWLALNCATEVAGGQVLLPSHEKLPRGTVVRVA